MNITKIIISLSGIALGVFLWIATASLFGINLGVIFLIFWIVAYLGSSLRKIGPNELALELFFGKPIKEFKAGHGLVFCPRGFYELHKAPSQTVQFQVPGEPEKIQKGSDEKDLQEGMVRPVRITTGENPGTIDPLDKRLVLEFSWIIRWRRRSLRLFTKNVGSEAEANRQLRDTSEKALVEILGNKTPSEIIKGIESINKDLVKILQGLVDKPLQQEDSWGVEIEDFQLLAPDLSHDLSAAMRDSAEADYKKVTTIKNAEADAESTKLKGKAEAEKLKAIGLAEAEVLKAKGVSVANAKELLLKAEATGLKKLADELGIKETALLLQLEAFKEAVSKAGENGHIFFNMPNIASIPELFGAINNKKTT